LGRVERTKSYYSLNTNDRGGNLYDIAH